MARTMGRYELVWPLARGGMAEVFVARRRGPGGVEKRLVVKRIRRERAADPRFLDLFVEEARLSMSLAHRNVVPVFDFGRADDDLFLAMEYVEGHDLGAVLGFARERGEPLPPLLIAYIGLEACGALDYAHNARRRDEQTRAVVHRDVTPRNVLISTSGEVKLVDFGIALAHADTGGGVVRGTPAYMAPEQARGESLDGRADLFGLGLVLWEALAGHRARPHRDRRAALAAAREGGVPPLPPEVPEALAAIVARATRTDREERYANAREMQLDLDEYIVAARAAAGGKPPALRLADVLDEMGPRVQTSSDHGEEATVDDVVVTFLDDGLERVASTLAAGEATLRSIAETVAEGGPEGTSEGEGDGDGERERAGEGERGGRGGWWWIVPVAAMVAGIAVAAVALSGGGDGGAAGSAPDGAAPAVARGDGVDARVATSVVHAAASLDAAVAIDAGVADARARTARGDGPVRVIRDPVRRRADAAPVETGTVRVSSSPWARVSARGVGLVCAETPCTFELPVGRHTLELVNPVAQLSKQVVVEVVAGETAIVRETLTR